MWPKFGNSSISMREVIIEKFSHFHERSYQFYKDLTKNTIFFDGCSWLKFNNLGLALGMAFKIHTSMKKGLKQKVRKF